MRDPPEGWQSTEVPVFHPEQGRRQHGYCVTEAEMNEWKAPDSTEIYVARCGRPTALRQKGDKWMKKRPRVFHPGATFAERLWRHEVALRPGALRDWEMLAYLQRELVCPHCGTYRQLFEDDECEDQKYEDAVEAQHKAAERQKAERAHLQVVKPSDGPRT